jgi:small-conductance mechanosensitive channel
MHLSLFSSSFRRPAWLTFALLLVAGLMLAIAAPTLAQGNAGDDATSRIVQAELDVRAVDRALDADVKDEDRAALRSRAQSAKDASTQAVAELTEQLGLINARIAGLGTVTPGDVEAPELRAQRRTLTGTRTAIDAAIKRGRLAGVEAGQLIDEIDRSKAEQFSQKLSSKVPSPLSPTFWTAVLDQAPRDLRRVTLFLRQGGDQLARQWQGGIPWHAMLGCALAVLLMGPIRLGAHRLAQRRLVAEAPPSRVRRSSNALWRVIVGTLCPLAAAFVFVQGLHWSGLLPQRWTGLLDGLVFASGLAGFTAAVTGAVLMRSQPSWRIAPIDDETAQRLRPLSWVLTILTFATAMTGAFVVAIGSSRAAFVTTQAIEALLHLMLIVVTLVVLGRLRAARAAHAECDETASAGVSAGLSVAVLLAWIAVGVAMVALLIGYIWFSWFVALMIGWAVLIGSALYLTMVAADDIATTVFVRDSKVGVTLTRALGVRGSMVDQFGLVLSGTVRLALVLLALGMLLQPFGASGDPSAVFGRLRPAGTAGRGNKDRRRVGVARRDPSGAGRLVRRADAGAQLHALAEPSLSAGHRPGRVGAQFGQHGGALYRHRTGGHLGTRVAGHRDRANRAAAVRAVGRDRLRPAGDHAEFRLRPDPARRAADQDRRSGARRHR